MCDSNFAARNLYHFFMKNYDLRKKEILNCGKTRSKMTKKYFLSQNSQIQGNI